MTIASHTTTASEFWQQIRTQAQHELAREPLLDCFFRTTVLDHASLAAAVSALLARQLQNAACSENEWRTQFEAILAKHQSLLDDMQADLCAVVERDRACRDSCHALCFFKGFHALAAYRLMHIFWTENHQPLALLMQHRISVEFGVDIHPAARIGSGILFDHATGIVVGETAAIGNNVSIMQGVTLGGTGKAGGDRHPKIRDDVLISVGAIILGNIEIGEGAQVAAGSVVLEAVAPHTLVAGVPAKVVCAAHSPQPALVMDHQI